MSVFDGFNNGFPQFPIPFEFTSLNVSQLANIYYKNSSIVESNKFRVYADDETKGLLANQDPIKLEEVIIYSNQSTLEFENFDLTLFTSTDGVSLLQQYKEVEVFSNQIIVFLEIDNQTNFFGSVMRIKVGSGIFRKKRFTIL